MEVENIPYEPLKKKQILGLKTIARTIRIDQDKKLRLLTERTGRGISELTREAIISFLKMRNMLK